MGDLRLWSPVIQNPGLQIAACFVAGFWSTVMAYGELRGRKAPGEFNFADYFGFASAGSVGIIAAILVDLQQSADASALFVMNKWISNFSGLLGFGELPLYVVVLILMALGAASIIYFQPVTMQSAFIQGFSVLAALMTLAPADLGGSLEAPMEMDDELPPPAEASLQPQIRNAAYMGSLGGAGVRGGIQPAVYQKAVAQVETVSLQRDGAAQGYNLTLVITFPNGLREDASTMIRRGTLRGRVYNSATEKSYNMFRSSGAEAKMTGNRLTIRTSLDGTDDTTKVYARVEAAGYAITIEEFEASIGRNPNWEINMTPSNTPLFLQRLGKSYWF